MVATGGPPLAHICLSARGVSWLEGRPLEGGRMVLMHHAANGTTRELTPSGYNVRTMVHEYGGGAFVLHGATVFFSNFADQRLYRHDPDAAPRPITPEPTQPQADRYADADAGRGLLICVRERHSPGREATNDLMVVAADGSTPPRSVVSGHDFYAFPRISPTGRHLAWTAWNHPQMPWDGCELWVGDLGTDGTVTNAVHVAGGPDESVFQPAWSPQGVLHFVSDRTGWWNLYRLDNGRCEALAPMEAEFAVPQWGFGYATYDFLPEGRIVAVSIVEGVARLGVLVPGGGLQPMELPYSWFGPRIQTHGDHVAVIAGGPTTAPEVALINCTTTHRRVLHRSAPPAPTLDALSTPQPIVFPGRDGQEVHALFYPPRNPAFTGPPEERPPLLVHSHGGPTSMAATTLRLELQYWTSRGFAVVDVNYRGSSGFGRAYRQRLTRNWGIADPQDCIDAARFLADHGEVDRHRLVIRGSSAGGYTTLCALIFHDDFAAGASYYGVADCEALARDTHKFESHYLDSLIGPYPEAQQTYYARSPLHFTDRFSCPVIVFQGLEDPVVPPAQAEQIVHALRDKGLPVTYLPFAGERHGFRKADTIERALEAELAFYASILDFPLAPATRRSPTTRDSARSS
jgi:dipeptidyl aminopeptidase/acylaminoacyl peptidase